MVYVKNPHNTRLKYSDGRNVFRLKLFSAVLSRSLDSSSDQLRLFRNHLVENENLFIRDSSWSPPIIIYHQDAPKINPCDLIITISRSSMPKQEL